MKLTLNPKHYSDDDTSGDESPFQRCEDEKNIDEQFLDI